MGRLFGPKPAAPEPTPEPTPPPTPTPPAGMTREEVQELLTGALKGVGEQVTGAITAMGERVEALASRQPQVVVQSPGAPIDRGISNEELDNAFLTGQGAADRVRALVDRAVNERAARLIKEHIEPLQNFGVQAIGNLSTELATGKMPFYSKYKKEIDQRMNALTPSAKADPTVLKIIHDAVVGEHAVELQREAAEEAIRKASEAPAAPAAPATRSRGSVTAGTGAAPGVSRDVEDLPTPGDLGGNDALAALSHKGRGGVDQDAFAQSMGYDSWSAYIKQYNALVDAETKGNA